MIATTPISSCVLMCCYRNDNPIYLLQAFNSIMINQTMKPDHLILVIDGPVDNKLEDAFVKMQHILPNKITILRNKQNLGLSKSLNEGIRLCHSYKYILRMDADDIAINTRVYDQILFMENNVNCQIASSNVIIYNENMTEVTGKRFLPKTISEIIKYSLRRTPINHTATIFRSSLFLKISYPDTRLPFEDWWLCLRAIKANIMIHTINKAHVKFRGGYTMYSRRAGYQYLKQELNFLKLVHKEGLISKQSLYVNIFFRSVARLMPKKFIIKIYKLFMHK